MTLADRIVTRSKTERYALALGLLSVAVLGGCYGLVVPFIEGVSAAGDWRADARASIRAERSLAAREPVLRESLAKLNDSPLWPMFQRGEGGADIAAALEREVRDLQARSGLSVRAVEVVPMSVAGATNRYGVTVRGTARIGQLNAFLVAVRASRHLRVENLRVYAPTFGAGSVPDELELSIEVVRYVLPAEEVARG